MKLVLVQWLDANAGVGWTDQAEGIAPVYSVGWLLSRNRKEVKLAADTSHEDGDENDINRTLAIPMALIEAIKELDVGTVLYQRPPKKIRAK